LSCRSISRLKEGNEGTKVGLLPFEREFQPEFGLLGDGNWKDFWNCVLGQVVESFREEFWKGRPEEGAYSPNFYRPRT